MLADLLYHFIPYQIFKSVFFRAGMGYLTTYFLISFIMPGVILAFRRNGITSEFSKKRNPDGPHSGATPIMGGVVLIPSVVVSALLWAWMNEFTVSLMVILLAFGVIGLIDDVVKVMRRRRIEAGKSDRKSYAEKADGISGRLRLAMEFGVTLIVFGGIVYISDSLDTRVYIPGIPSEVWFPVLPLFVFVPWAVFIVVAGANAVNLTDGLDTLATVPILTCAFFIATAAYVSGEEEFAKRLKILFISNDFKEVAVFAVVVMGACMAFLKFNSPPASIYMGDVGSLSLGAVVAAMFIFVNAELFLPIVGGSFVIAAVTVIVQRLWFKWALKKRGRAYAEKNRFFYRAPYHHHQQVLFTYSKSPIRSLFHEIVKKFGYHRISEEDQFENRNHANNKVIWRNHLQAIWLLVICLIIFFKVR